MKRFKFSQLAIITLLLLGSCKARQMKSSIKSSSCVGDRLQRSDLKVLSEFPIDGGKKMGLAKLDSNSEVFLFYGSDDVKAISLSNLDVSNRNNIKNAVFRYDIGSKGKLELDIASGRLDIDLGEANFKFSKKFDELEYNSENFEAQSLSYSGESDYPFYVLNKQKQVFKNYESALMGAQNYSRKPQDIKRIMINLRENPPVWDEDFLRNSFDTYYSLQRSKDDYSRLFYAKYNEAPKNLQTPALSFSEQRSYVSKIRDMANTKKAKLHFDLMGEVPENIVKETKMDADWIIFRNRSNVKLNDANNPFSFRSSDYLSDSNANNVRFYMNVNSNQAPEVFEDVLSIIEESNSNSVLMAKICHPVHGGRYTDNIVFYVSATDARLLEIEDKLALIHKNHKGKFIDATPKGTSPFAPGIGKAENPGDDFSYGMLLSSIVSNAAKKLDQKRNNFSFLPKYKMANASNESLYGTFLYKYYRELEKFKFDFNSGTSSYTKKVDPNDISKFINVESNP